MPSASMPEAMLTLGRVGTRLWTSPTFRKACPSPWQDGWWDFSEEAHRLALLSPEELYRVCLYFSAAVHADDMAHIINRAGVLELKAHLGDDIYSYALKRGRYQIGTLKAPLLEATTAVPAPLRAKALADALFDALRLSWPEGLRKRFDIRMEGQYFSQERDPLCSLPPLTPQQHRAFWFTLKKILIREAAPQWAPCFD